jgi:hypothetical protein
MAPRRQGLMDTYLLVDVARRQDEGKMHLGNAAKCCEDRDGGHTRLIDYDGGAREL